MQGLDPTQLSAGSDARTARASQAPASPWETEDSRIFRRTVRQFIAREFVPRIERWRAQRQPDRESWLAAGRAGLLLPDVPGDYGGGDGSFAHEAVVLEELATAGVHFGSNVQSTVAHYVLAYGTEEQRKRWLPRLARGELVAAIAMTEPAAGSDLLGIRTTARLERDDYVVTGQKTFASNGRHAGLVCLVARTDPKSAGFASLSVLMVETEGLAGYATGRALEKLGRHEQDTCELFFDGVRVPRRHLLGSEGAGFTQIMEQLPYERLSVAVSAIAGAERALSLTIDHAKQRRAFDKALIDFQNARFKLAECAAGARVGRVFVDHCVQRAIAGELDGASAATAKLWSTELQARVLDECVQLHGGYGYMLETPVARMWADARAQRIYAGTNEIMKEIIAWAL